MWWDFIALDGTDSSGEEWLRWSQGTVFNRVVLRENDVRLLLDLAATSKVEAVDTGAQVGSICFRASECEHTHSGLSGSRGHARQVSYVSSTTSRQELWHVQRTGCDCDCNNHQNVTDVDGCPNVPASVSHLDRYWQEPATRTNNDQRSDSAAYHPLVLSRSSLTPLPPTLKNFLP